MKKNIVIIGAGDFGREVAWLIRRINDREDTWNLLGFVDDKESLWGTQADGYPVLGGSDWLKRYEGELSCVCSVGTGAVRKRILEKLAGMEHMRYPVLIDPSAVIGEDAAIGEGSIVCAGCILTVGIHVGKHVILNLNTTLGHDDVIGDYNTINPGCNLSGKIKTGECVDIGTGTTMIQGLHIAGDTIFGAGSVVVRNVDESGTYVGVPVKKIK